MLVKTHAIILSAIKYGDSSKIISAYSRDFGKITLIAKGAFSAKSKFGSSIEPMTISNIGFNYNANKSMFTLSLAESYFKPNKIIQNNMILALGMMVIEAIKYSKEDNHQNIQLFEAAESAIINLENTPLSSLATFIEFMCCLCRELGFEIIFSWKNQKEKENAGEIVFCALENCKIASVSNALSGAIIRIDKVDLELIRNVQQKDTIIHSLNPTYKQVNSVINFFERYLSLHLDKRFQFKSKELLNY